jgi:heterodisulfide reductase subunit A
VSEKIGVYVCHCGTNIAGIVDVEAVSSWALELPGVVVSRDYKFMCSSPGQDLIEEDIKELGLTRVVVAACSPHLHESTFRGLPKIKPWRRKKRKRWWRPPCGGWYTRSPLNR